MVLCFIPTALLSQQVSPEAALKRLEDGNKRFVSQELTNPGRDIKTVKELTHGQHPYAIIICCSDSRTPPEIIFDEGLGSLFVIRVAGNVADQYALASIEYAAKNLGTELVLVLGHTECGAVHATVEVKDYGPNLNSLVAKIMPAVIKAKAMEGNVMENAVEENVLAVQKEIEADTELKSLYSESKLKVVPAIYNLETGNVTVIEH
jgi:carbonic anhydrase